MGIELGIGESLLVKAIAESTGRASTKIKEDLRKEGDLGKVAMVSSSTCEAASWLIRIDVPEHPTYDVQAETFDRPRCLQGSDRDS